MSSFSVKPVKEYLAGYPKKGFFRKSFVVAVPIRLFSLLVVGMLFFITVPGCIFLQTSGEPIPNYESDDDVVNDNEKVDIDEIIGLPNPPDDSFLDNDTADIETNDFDQIDGGAVPECLEDKDCDEGYYCDLSSYTCVEQLLGDPIPDYEVADDALDETEVPDEELSGFAPPVLKK